MRLLVISPHLDDAVLGCADLLASHPGAVVVTVMGGRPEAYPTPLPPWDRTCGYADGDDVVAARRREDERALAQLGATAHWLGFLDQQYAPTARPTPGELADALARVIGSRDVELVASPLGVFHPDHVLTASGGLELATRLPALRWLLYAEAPYKTDHPDHVESALAVVRAHGFEPAETNPAPPIGHALKRSAIECYASQLPAIAGWERALLPERYWRLQRRA